MSPTVALATFLAVFVAELPDKTNLATMVMAARFRRPAAVWLGAATAFVIQVTLAVVAGGLIARLPARPVAAAAGVLFGVGAIVIWREGADDHDDDSNGDPDDPTTSTGSLTAPQVFARAFGVVFVAELGDLTQLATAGLAASTDQPAAVLVGALAALWCASGVAVVAGQRVLARLPEVWLHRVAAGLFALLSLAAFVQAARA
jgi:putative Ca2+/H+ antiporter (TMEM165/GDT1 family)